MKCWCTDKFTFIFFWFVKMRTVFFWHFPECCNTVYFQSFTRYFYCSSWALTCSGKVQVSAFGILSKKLFIQRWSLLSAPPLLPSWSNCFFYFLGSVAILVKLPTNSLSKVPQAKKQRIHLPPSSDTLRNKHKAKTMKLL